MKSKPFFILAPMDDVTDTVFRQIVAICAPPDLYITEFVNVDGLQSRGRPKLLKKLRFTPEDTPLVAQIWGLKPENFEKTAREIADGSLAKALGLPEGINFVGIDLNMGCPVKSEVKNGTCSALIKNRPLAQEIIEATQKGAGKMPVSVKTRLGWNEIDLSWHEFLLGFNLEMLTVHARTRKEMSKVEAHWDVLPDIITLRDKISPDTKIVGNGDVMNRRHGLELAEKYGIDGIMIGRGVFHDPYCFSDNSPWVDLPKADKIALFKRQVDLFADTWNKGERRFETLKKFAKIYINNFEGATELRDKAVRTTDIEDLQTVLAEALDQI